MAYDGLVSEQPAFASHKTYQRSKRNNSTSRKRLCDCCFSVANLLIILASILALIQCVQFLFDQPLYDYGDYLLGVRFYRQIIYIIVIVPLLFLVPIYNAIDALFIAASTHPSTASVLFNLKLGYQFLALVLIVIGLVFVAPYIRTSPLEGQLELEFRRYMKKRYDDEFSYEFLDRIQQDYKCCDQPWYRLNYHDRVPLSCTEPVTFDFVYSKTCAEVIADLVSYRCAIIASCLLAFLLSFSGLVALDLIVYKG